MLRAVHSLLMMLALAACGGSGRGDLTEERLAIVHLNPVPVADGEALIFLNQEIEIYFNEVLDPLSIDEETLRVVDSEGRGVPGTRSLGLSGHSVIFTPIPPVQRDLSDGSYRPGERYQLQIAGFPRAHAVRAQSGRRLSRGCTLDLRAVQADSKAQGFPTAFQFLGTGEEPFRLARHLEMAAGSQVLRMHFSLPILPGSLRPEAVHVFKLTGKGLEEPRHLQPESLRILPIMAEPGLHYGSTVELLFAAEERFDVTDKLGVLLFSEPNSPDDPAPFRDYRGRAVSVSRPEPVIMRPGTRVALLSLDFANDPRLHNTDQSKLGFETRRGRVQPLCRLQAGTGELGWFRPQQNVVLVAGSPYLPGAHAPRVPADGDLQFLGVEIPAGVTVTLRSNHPGGLVMRSCSGIHIAGILRIEAPTSHWDLAEIAAGPLPPPSAADLLTKSYVSLLAAGDIRVTGRVESDPELGSGSPLSLISGGRILLAGNLIPQVVLAVEDTASVLGPVESPILIGTSLESGLSAGTNYSAEAFTDWYPLDSLGSGRIQVELKGLQGSMEVAAQLAPPHPVREGEPHQDAELLRQPLMIETGAELDAITGWYIRFRLRAEVVGGSLPLPSLRRIVIYAN